MCSSHINMGKALMEQTHCMLTSQHHKTKLSCVSTNLLPVQYLWTFYETYYVITSTLGLFCVFTSDGNLIQAKLLLGLQG